MKRSLYFLLMSLFLSGLSLSVVSCSNDDEGIGLETPKYESVSGKYVIPSEDSPYSSIELGASGDYIVILNENNVGLANNEEQIRYSLFGPKVNGLSQSTRGTDYDGVIYGKYKLLDNGDFDLEGFGVVKIIYGNDKQVNAISITPDNGEEIEFDVIKEDVVESDDFTNSFCRTWKVDKIEDVYYKNDKVVYTDEYVDVKEVFLSKSGTYMVVYYDGTVGISSWKWKSKEDKTIYYSWDNIWEEDAWVELSFEGKTLVVREVFNESGEVGDGITFDKNEMFTYLSEK